MVVLDNLSFRLLVNVMVQFFNSHFNCSDCGVYVTTIVVNSEVLSFADYNFRRVADQPEASIREGSFKLDPNRTCESNAKISDISSYHDYSVQELLLRHSALCYLKFPWPMETNTPPKLFLNRRIIKVDGVTAVTNVANGTTNIAHARSLPSEELFGVESEISLPFSKGFFDPCGGKLIRSFGGKQWVGSIYSRKVKELKNKKMEMCFTAGNATKYSQVFDIYQMNTFLNDSHSETIQKIQEKYPDAQVTMVVRFHRFPNSEDMFGENPYFHQCHHFLLEFENVEIFIMIGLLVLVLLGGLMINATLIVITLDHMFLELKRAPGKVVPDVKPSGVLKSIYNTFTQDVTGYTEVQSEADEHSVVGGQTVNMGYTVTKDTHEPTKIEGEPTTENNEKTNLFTTGSTK